MRNKLFSAKKAPAQSGFLKTSETGLRDKCGIFGIYGKVKMWPELVFGLYSLQHRGQGRCRITVQR